MRTFRVLSAGVTFCALVGCAAAQVGSALVTRSPLPGMQQYNRHIGYDYWVQADSLQLCEKPIATNCSQSLTLGTHVKVDGLVPNHSEVLGRTSDQPYFHIVTDDGRSGFVDARDWSIITTTVDPAETAAAAAECKKRGAPKLGMNAKQVAATCWGPPNYVNAKVRATGKYEQYVYGDNKFVYLRDGVVTSVSVKGRSLEAVRALH
jgi:hypothetical protein